MAPNGTSARHQPFQAAGQKWGVGRKTKEEEGQGTRIKSQVLRNGQNPATQLLLASGKTGKCSFCFGLPHQIKSLVLWKKRRSVNRGLPQELVESIGKK